MNPVVVELLDRVMPLTNNLNVYIVAYSIMAVLACIYIVLIYRKGGDRWYM
jgi:hypothetical protein